LNPGSAQAALDAQGLSWKEVSSLGSDGCSAMPLDPSKDWSVFSLGASAALLSKLTLGQYCSSLPAGYGSDPSVSMCVAFTECGGLPTFAMQFSPSAVGCFFGNGEVAAASSGLSVAIEEAVKLGGGSVGMGISLSGQFRVTGTVFTGPGYNTASVTVNGNLYSKVAVNILKTMPESVTRLLKAGGTGTVTVGMAGGDAEKLLSASNMNEFLSCLPKVTFLGTFSIVASIQLDELSKGALADFPLYKLNIAGLMTTDTIGPLSITATTSGRVPPGLYLYADSHAPSVSSVMVSAAEWVAASAGEIIDKIVQHCGGAAGASKTMVGAVKKLAGSMGNDMGDARFGIFVNTESFGMMFEIPAAYAAAIMPGGEVVGAAVGGALGRFKVECHYKYTADSFVCGCGYDAPKYLAAILAEGQKILGEVEHTAEAAVHNVDKYWNDSGARQFFDTVGDRATKWTNTADNWYNHQERGAEKTIIKSANQVDHFFQHGGGLW